MSVTSSERRNLSDETAASSVQVSPSRFIYPHDPHTKTLNDIDPWSSWRPDPGSPPIAAHIYTLPLDNSHKLVSRWPVLAPEIIAFMDQSHVAFVGLELWRRSQDRNISLSEGVTVLITVESLSDLNDDLLHRAGKFIHDKCGKHKR